MKKTRCEKSGLEWLTFDLFAEIPHLVHGIFLRHGGVSSGAFSSLNFGFTAGDLPENVLQNRQRALKALGISHCVSLYQEHGNKIVEAKLGSPKKGDALITDCVDLGLMILHADCQAAIFYDPIHRALANVHCGWKGNVANIYSETVQSMQKRFGSNPKDLLVGISPSLGPLASEFIHFQKELPLEFYPFQCKPTFFNLWEISKWQLKEVGILEHHIEIAELCTFQHESDFFSYRREKKSGRHATIAAFVSL